MQGFVHVILAARRYIYIETPYFLPNEPVFFALKTAAVAGIDVHLLVPLHGDARFTEWAGRSFLREANEAGIRVSLYNGGFLHSKLMVVDDAIVTCGSTNVDFRSFENNFEANVFIYDEQTALGMKQIFLDDASQSILLSDLPHRSHPPFLKRLGESLCRILAPLM
jgi:cardiolipin synthase